MGLDTVEFVLELEAAYSIEISDADSAELGVVGDMARYIVRESAAQNGAALEFEQVLHAVIELLVSSHGVPRQRISSVSHVVADLGLDYG